MAFDGYLKRTTNGEVVRGDSTAVDHRGSIGFSEFQISMGKESNPSGGVSSPDLQVRPAWCRLPPSQAVPSLMQAYLEVHRCNGICQFVDKNGRSSWSIGFGNARIRDLRFFPSSQAQAKPAYYGLEIEAEAWEFNQGTAGPVLSQLWKPSR